MSEKYKILIVEDQSKDRLLLRKILESMGYHVHEAVDGQKGLEMAHLHKPDLIISDALMPRMDGFRFLRNIRKDKDLKNIPFIFYSAVYTGNKDEKLALSLGARAFIEKPIEPAVFIEKLKSIIQEIKLKKVPEPVELIEEEEEYLKRYSDIVATKLEEKVAELEKINERLKQQIIERKRAEEQTKQLQEHLQLQISRMPIGLIVWDTEFRVQTWNPGAEKIFGFAAKEALGKHPYNIIVSKETESQVDNIWRKLLKGDRTVHSTNENITKDRRTITCEWSNTPLKKADGTIVGVLSMIQDITERKQAEEELEKHRQHLEELVKERTAELEKKNAELREFNKLFLGREIRIKELKDKVKELEKTKSD